MSASGSSAVNSAVPVPAKSSTAWLCMRQIWYDQTESFHTPLQDTSAVAIYMANSQMIAWAPFCKDQNELARTLSLSLTHKMYQIRDCH